MRREWLHEESHEDTEDSAEKNGQHDTAPLPEMEGEGSFIDREPSRRNAHPEVIGRGSHSGAAEERWFRALARDGDENRYNKTSVAPAQSSGNQDTGGEEEDVELDTGTVQLTAFHLNYAVRPASGIPFVRSKPKTLLSDVSVVFKPGELVALMGASGAGKTTLLRTLSGEAGGLVSQSAFGEREGGQMETATTLPPMSANGFPLFPGPAGTGPLRRMREEARLRPTRLWLKRVSKVVPQEDILLPALTARRTLLYAAELMMPGASKEDRAARVKEVLKKLNLSAAGDTKVGQPDKPNLRGLSGGERKRLSIGLELLSDPAVLLLDEPTTGLDSKNAADVVNEMKRLAGEGRTIVCSIHQPSFEILQTFDRLVLLEKGRVSFCGKVSLLPRYLDHLDVNLRESASLLNPVEQYVAYIQRNENKWPETGPSFLALHDPEDPTLNLLSPQAHGGNTHDAPPVVSPNGVRHSLASQAVHHPGSTGQEGRGKDTDLLEGTELPREDDEEDEEEQSPFEIVSVREGGGRRAARVRSSNDSVLSESQASTASEAGRGEGGSSDEADRGEGKSKEKEVDLESGLWMDSTGANPKTINQKARGGPYAVSDSDTSSSRKRHLREGEPLESPFILRKQRGGLRLGRVSWWVQFRVLCCRAFHDELCDTNKFLANCITRALIGVLVGLCWLNQGRPPDSKNIFPLSGVLFTLVNNAVMGNLFSTVLSFPSLRALAAREHRNGMYSVSSFYAANLVCTLVTQLLLSMLMGLPVYFMVGLNPDSLRVGLFVLCLALLCFIGTSLGLALGSVANDFKDAQQTLLPILVPLFLFSGYVIPYNSIPDYFQWLYWVSFFQYAFSLLRINEFKGIDIHDKDDCDPYTHTFFPWTGKEGVCYRTGDEYLKSHKVHLDPSESFNNVGPHFAVLVAFLFFFWVVGFGLLRWKLTRKTV
uniref:ABC transporter domain-containing protein n=1 Tax=Chromera velia CCMP2878 TaxID=1169474 RepID=A0A0G4HZB8_9ALVE|eukprot:Cvel_9655.t1-p1 / transcript=Cvel_9655.t1 / gene=Cvel_9655 / organism=Chromera_velia_CCMP2878 / gene_product=Protein white, putative / transcript_product=Protein white, putative / location=Cvel_scaffold562:17052-23882(-) / protein_length=936 / sequence_SO=supercontig / SO=protein_coding / is_pseudo=false